MFVIGLAVGIIIGILLVLLDIVGKTKNVTNKVISKIRAGEIIKTTPDELRKLNKKEQHEIWYAEKPTDDNI